MSGTDVALTSSHEAQYYGSGLAAPAEAPDAAGEAERPKGTFASTVFTAFNSAVGTGILTLPYAFRCLGLFGGALVLLAFVIIEFGTLKGLVHCSHNPVCKSYPEVVRLFLGREAGIFFGIVICTYCFFACTSGLVICKNVLTPILMLASDHKDEWWTSKIFQVCAAGVVAFPLMCLKTITSLQYTAMLSFTAILYVVGVVVANYNSNSADDGDMGPLDYWGEWPSAMLAIPNIFVALQCHIQVPGIYAELPRSDKSVSRMCLALATSYFMCFCLYFTIGVFGMLTFRRLTRPNIMECAYNAAAPDIIVARACLATTAVLSVPINHFPARQALWGLMSGSSKAPMSKEFQAVEVMVFAGLVVLLACVIDELSTLNDLMGLSAGVAVIFVLPALFLHKRPAMLAMLVEDDDDAHLAQVPYYSQMSMTLARVNSGRANRQWGAAGSLVHRVWPSVFMLVGVGTMIISLYSFIGNTWLNVDPPGVNATAGSD